MRFIIIIIIFFFTFFIIIINDKQKQVHKTQMKDVVDNGSLGLGKHLTSVRACVSAWFISEHHDSQSFAVTDRRLLLNRESLRRCLQAVEGHETTNTQHAWSVNNGQLA